MEKKLFRIKVSLGPKNSPLPGIGLNDIFRAFYPLDCPRICRTDVIIKAASKLDCVPSEKAIMQTEKL